MNVMVPLPEEFAARFGSEAERDRHVLEVLALDEYRAGRMSKAELRQVLGFGTSGELDGFLKDHGILEGTETKEAESAIRSALREGDEDEGKAAAAELVEKFRTFRAGKTLGGLNLKDLIAEGRR